MSHELKLCLHTGGEEVPLERVEQALTPQATQTWQPIPHAELYRGVKQTIENTGLQVVHETHGLARDGLRYFGMMQVQGQEADSEYGFVVGLRNSHDRSFPAGLACGSGVFICDNLAFSSEIVLARKHTLHIRRDLPQLISTAVGKLGQFRVQQAQRYEKYHHTELVEAQVHDALIQAVDAQAIPLLAIPQVLTEWRTPQHPEFAKDGKTAWRLFNAFTEALKGRGGADSLVKRTLVLHGLLDSMCGVLAV
jgi:hypothetical protein